MKLAIGSANFGMNYGIGERKKLSQNEINSILDFAIGHGIDTIDTAPNYGTSEIAIGKSSPNKKFKIYTKTPSFDNEQQTGDYKKKIREFFFKSLDNLKTETIEGIAVHQTPDILHKNGYEIWETLLEIKNEKRVNNIGLSIYPDINLKKLLKKIRPDFVQLPISIFDQRVKKNGLLKILVSEGIKIHTRSLFLQGILTSPLDNIPNFHHRLKHPLKNFINFIGTLNMTPVEASFSFIKQFEHFDFCIIGLQSKKELKEILKAYKENSSKLDWGKFSVSNDNHIDPRFWKK